MNKIKSVGRRTDLSRRKSRTKDDGSVIDYFSSNGELGTRTHYTDKTIIGVRPALWVDIDYIIERSGINYERSI